MPYFLYFGGKKMKKKAIIFSSIGGAVLLAIIILIICLCLPKGGYRVIKLMDFENSVKVIRNNADAEVKKNMNLKNEDELVVGSSSKAILKLDSDKYILAKENTSIKLQATGKKNNTKTRILVSEGGVVVEVKQHLKDNEAFEIASSNSVMAIRGTQIGFDVSKTADTLTTRLSILDGTTNVMLYKDNRLKSTELMVNQGLTYESSLSDTKPIDEMSNLIDTATVVKMSDRDLLSEYSTSKRELTSEEIDSIVDAVNSFERLESEYLNGTIKFKNLPTSIEYGIDPKDYLDTDKTYSGIKYLYSSTIDGGYTEYDPYDPVPLGTWYFKAISNDAYRSDPIQLEVSERNLNLKFKGTQQSYLGTASLNVELENYDDIFKLNVTEEPSETYLRKYMYYIELSYLNTSSGLTHSIIIDRDNYKDTFDYFFKGVESATVNVTYNLPDGFIVASGNTFTFNFKNTIDLSNTIVNCDVSQGAGTNDLTIYPANYYAINAESQLKVMKKTTDIGGNDSYEELAVTYTDQSITYRFDDSQVEIALETFEFDGTNYNKGYHEFNIDFSHSTFLSETSITGTNVYDNPITYNSDNTMNVYFDAQFIPSTSGIMYLASAYSENTDENEVCYATVGSNTRFVIFEDMYITQYHIGQLDAVTLYNEVYYTVREGDADHATIDPINSSKQIATLYAYDDYTVVFQDCEQFKTDKPITVYTENNKIYTVDTINGYTFDDYSIDGVYSNLYIEATIYSSFYYLGTNNDQLFDIEGDPRFLSEDVFAEVVRQMKTTYGITIKGDSYTTIRGFHVSGV